MNKAITANEFLSAWENACHEKHDLVFETWPNSAEFTRLVFDAPNSLFEHTGRQLGLQAYAGYYHIDGVLFEEEDRVPECPVGQTWLRRVRVAFEHENNFESGLFQEIAHLMLLDVGLRVLVSYPGTEEYLQSQLQYLHGLIGGSARSTRFCHDEQLLIISGFRDLTQRSFSWVGDVYDSDSWRRIS